MLDGVSKEGRKEVSKTVAALVKYSSIFMKHERSLSSSQKLTRQIQFKLPHTFLFS